MAVAEPGALAFGKQPGAPAGECLCFGLAEFAGEYRQGFAITNGL